MVAFNYLIIVWPYLLADTNYIQHALAYYICKYLLTSVSLLTWPKTNKGVKNLFNNYMYMYIKLLKKSCNKINYCCEALQVVISW